MNLESLFSITPEINFANMFINLVLSAVLSWLLGWHFTCFGSVFSNRTKFSRVLLPIALTTTLVISVVKSSLALSLGLVGALSIVRFRTPVKEPEELAYLFMAIAIGLGTGANQIVITVFAMILILALLTVRALLHREPRYPNLYLNLILPRTVSREKLITDLLDLLTEHVATIDLRRYDVHESSIQATFYLDIGGVSRLAAIENSLREKYPNATFTFVEQSGLPGA